MHWICLVPSVLSCQPDKIICQIFVSDMLYMAPRWGPAHPRVCRWRLSYPPGSASFSVRIEVDAHSSRHYPCAPCTEYDGICINVYPQNNQHIPYITIHRASTQSHKYSIDINYTILNHTKTPACHCQWDQWFSENHVKRGWFIKHDGQMWE